MNIELLAADIASRREALARDNITNATAVIKGLIQQELARSKNIEARWIILFRGNEEWEFANGTLQDAINQATCDRRHQNYGHTGFIIFENTGTRAEIGNLKS